MVKFKLFLLLVVSLLIYGCPTRTGCKDKTANNYDSKATKDCDNCCIYSNPSPSNNSGGVLFWVSNPGCGNVSVTLSNGQQSYITNYYSTPPANCVNICGGYFLLA